MNDESAQRIGTDVVAICDAVGVRVGDLREPAERVAEERGIGSL